jgi:hypothetical protein
MSNAGSVVGDDLRRLSGELIGKQALPAGKDPIPMLI